MNGLLQPPQPGTPEYQPFIDSIPQYLTDRTAANKQKYASFIAAAGLDPNTYDYANLQPEMLEKIMAVSGVDPKRALQLSTMDYGNSGIDDFETWNSSAGNAIKNGLTDEQRQAEYDKNKYSGSTGNLFMRDLTKTGIAAALAYAGLDATGVLGGAGSASGTGLGGAAAGSAGGGITLGAPVALGSSAGVTPAMIGGAAAGSAGGGGLLSTIGGALKPIGTAISGINDLTGGNLGAIIGGLAGAAASGDTTTSSQKDPWGPAQSYLKDNLAQNKRMQDYYTANPFSQEQKQAYQGLLNTNANGMSNAGNFNQIAQNFMGSNRGLLGQMPTLNQGVNAPQVDWTKYANIGKGG